MGLSQHKTVLKLTGVDGDELLNSVPFLADIKSISQFCSIYFLLMK